MMRLFIESTFLTFSTFSIVITVDYEENSDGSDEEVDNLMRRIIRNAYGVTEDKAKTRVESTQVVLKVGISPSPSPYEISTSFLYIHQGTNPPTRNL
jgi:hypothetical protein